MTEGEYLRTRKTERNEIANYQKFDKNLNKARNKFRFRSAWTSDRKIIYKIEGNNKAKIYFE